jgi:hypothetical protein
MTLYGFLASLPGVLGIAGFFAYLWAGQARVGGDLFKQIVLKLRAAPNLEIRGYSKLTPAKIGRLIESDARVRGVVNDQDQRLLRLLIIFQRLLTVIVLLVSAALIGVSVWIMSRPRPLSILVKGPEAMLPDSNGRLVDLDPITVEWTSSGRNEPVSVFLENVDTVKRTPRKPFPLTSEASRSTPKTSFKLLLSGRTARPIESEQLSNGRRIEASVRARRLQSGWKWN